MNPSSSAATAAPHFAAPHFADALVTRVRALGHPLCVGLDPHLGQIPPLFRSGQMHPSDPETARAIGDFLLAVVERLEGRVAVVKPQIAFFEQLGSPGIAALERVMARARERGLLVLLDAKRGDIGSTASAYARAYLDPTSSTAADALTINPYLGLDTLEPFAKAAREHGRGLFVLVRTSNPGAGTLQDLEVKGGAVSGEVAPLSGEVAPLSGEVAPLFEQVARSLASLSEEMRGPETGWSSVGVVVGATWPAQATAVREALPKSIFLIPGYGAQGGSASEAISGFVPGPEGLEGGIVSSSRGVLFPEGSDTDDAKTWERAIDAGLDRSITELGEAVRS